MNITIKKIIALLFCGGLICTLHAQNEIRQVLTMEEMFELADKASKTIKSHEANVNVAQSAVAVSKNAMLPDIHVSASASYNGNAWISDRDFSNGHSVESPHFGDNFAFEVSQVIFAGGAISNSVKAAELQSELAKLNLDSERQKVRFLLTGYYLNLYKFRNILSVYEKNIERVVRVIEDMQAREAQGIVLSNDITRYEVQLQNLKYRKTELLNNIDVYNNQLVKTLGLIEGTIIMPDTLLLDSQHSVSSELYFQDLAATNSPIIKINKKNVNLAETRKKIAHSEYFPKISLMAGDQLRGPITFEIPVINSNINTWFVGIGLSYNLGGLYKNAKTMKNSTCQVILAQSQLAESEEHISLEIHQAYAGYKNALELLSTQEKSLQLAKENYGVVENRYNNDLVLLVDLLDADNIRLDAEIQYENARINILYNYFKLLYTSGIL